MFNATDISYDGILLSSFGLTLCEFDSSSGLVNTPTGQLTFNTVKPIGSDRFALYSTQYDSALSTTFQVGLLDGNYLTPEQVSKINRWLCRKDGYHKFKIVNEDYENIYFNAVCNTNELKINGYTYGFEITITTDHPYAFLEPVEIEFSTDIDKVYSLEDTSDETGHIYPMVVITLLEDGDLTIHNSIEDRTMSIDNCVTGEVITIEGKNLLMPTSTLSSHDIKNNFNYKFLRIANTYSENENILTFSLSCDVLITYSPIRKIGV